MMTKRGGGRGGPEVLFVLGAVLILTGCSGGSSDRTAIPTNAAFSPAPATSATSAAKNDPEAYAACMRLNGVPKFPDPDVYGGYRLGPATGVDPRTPEYQAAYTACEHLA